MKNNTETFTFVNKTIDALVDIKKKIESGEESGGKTAVFRLLNKMLKEDLKDKKVSEMTPGEEVMHRIVILMESYIDVAFAEQLNKIEKKTLKNLKK